MKKDLKPYLDKFNSLELNKTTEDVETDLKHLNFKQRFKYISFYTSILVLGAGLYFGIVSEIKKDSFATALIEQQGVNPVAAYLTDTYTEELDYSEKKLKTLDKEINKISRDLRNMKSFSYSKNDFRNDIKSGAISDDIVNKAISKSDALKKLQKAHFFYWILNNDETEIVLNGNQYDIKKITSKAWNLMRKKSRNEATIALNEPAKKILKLMQLPLNIDYVNNLSSALIEVNTLNSSEKRLYKDFIKSRTDRMRYKVVNFDSEIQDSHKIIKDYFSKGYTRIDLVIRRNRNSITITIPNLRNEYEVEKQKQKQIWETARDGFEKKQEVNKIKLNDLKSKKEYHTKLIKAIKSLQNDPLTYIESEKKVIEILKEGK
ncbi:MAG: hypothetical protein U9N33_01235 [Campylobacterota bacterium]|nr:hypothetical protein [Campylobacterota bacterium]